MAKYKYQLIERPEFSSITVFNNGETLFATTDSHSNFAEIVRRVSEGDENALDLFDLKRAVKRYTDQALSGRVKVATGVIYLDNEPIDGALADVILRFVDEGLDPKPLVKFLENVMENPNVFSREHMYRWLKTHKFSITESGWIVGYKGLSHDFKSINAGPGFINGTPANGHLDNSIGNTVSIDRGAVTFDPSHGCAAGLHVGTWDYAKSFAQGKLVEVHVHPKDVVSVPTDCHDAKMRVCSYKVIREVAAKHEKTVVLD